MVTITFVGDVFTTEVVLLLSTGVQVSGAAVVRGIWTIYQDKVCHVFTTNSENFTALQVS